MTNDPSKMIGGADAFICEVIGKNASDKTWTVEPRIIEVDGKDHPTIKVNAVGGIDPQIGDVVLVVTARNNLDDEKISRYYAPSETNGRIIAIAKPQLFYTFKGDFEFKGTVLFTGGVQTTGDLLVQGDLVVEKSATITEDLIVNGTIVGASSITAGSGITAGGDITGAGKLTIVGEASVGSLKVNGKDWLLHTHPNNAPAPGPTGTATQV